MKLECMDRIVKMINIVRRCILGVMKWLIETWNTAVGVFSNTSMTAMGKGECEQKKIDHDKNTNDCLVNPNDKINSIKPEIQWMVDEAQKIGISGQGIRNKIMIEEIIRKIINK